MSETIYSTKPLVSISVVTYNHKHYIEQCIDSLLKQQTTFPFEIILGEDASQDGTRDICLEYAKKYPDVIRLFLRKREDVIHINGTATGRFNMMENIRDCRGKYIALCEGDDYWKDPLKLQKQVDFMEAHPDYVIHSGVASILHNDSNRCGHQYIGAERVDSDYKLEDFYGRNHLVTCTVLFRNCITHWPEVFKTVTLGDWFLYTVLLKQTGLKAYKSSDVLSVYRVHGTSMMQTLQPRVKYERRIFQIKAIKQYIGYKYYPMHVMQCINANSIGKVRVELSHKMYKAALLTFFKNLYYCKHRISVRKYFSALKHDFK
ncbi:glycosyltransferase family 2 protein [Aestuariibaculum sp. YM273]|uniref:glycosyltransferase family 2 protein n=1 Tax=Aestuariibaculum sp. YM273 TaxID=3070659 RepID=UPI0027DBA31B|nr:glycosyltransferase family 2 protein [Aestuariibaculum sp. YM273]WMI65837.1 glycosyltransferase family 2 protein [Aestuariibaculum sp. YM273]